jgi:NAD(P)-dependent dehydrogenase (short-subunit alcohol dehydrogenase family)
VQLGITDPASVTAAAAAAPDTTLLINNAGMLIPTSLHTGELPDITAEFDANFYGTPAMIRAFAGPIESNGGGSILNVLLPSTASPQTNTRSSPATSAGRYRPASPASQPSTPTSRRRRPDPRQQSLPCGWSHGPQR